MCCLESIFKLFAQIRCYLPKFYDILGKFISQKNLSVAAVNRCKVSKIFIPTKIVYSEPDIMVWENLRHLAFWEGVLLYWNGRRYMLSQIAIFSKTCRLLFMQLSGIHNPFKLLRRIFFAKKINSFQLLINIAKSCTSDVLQGSEYASSYLTININKLYIIKTTHMTTLRQAKCV